MIEVHAIPRHVLFKNLFGFFISDEPKLRNHGYQIKDGSLRVAISPSDVIKKKKIVYFGTSFIICVKSRIIL